VGTFDLSAPFSKLRDQKSRKRCQDKLHSVLDLWPSNRLHGSRLLSIKLHGIRLLDIRPHGIKPDGIRLLSISSINSDLYLPIRMANPKLTNQDTSRRSHRILRMINTIGSYLYGCRV
jgi:hypothetical protein